MTPTCKAYLECALWLTDDSPGSGEWSEHEPWTLDNIDPASVANAERDCATFETMIDMLRAPDGTDFTADFIGHNFWLTRNRHGAGFWDRGLGVVGDRLTEIAHSFGEADCYLGDDGKVHLT